MKISKQKKCINCHFLSRSTFPEMGPIREHPLSISEEKRGKLQSKDVSFLGAEEFIICQEDMISRGRNNESMVEKALNYSCPLYYPYLNYPESNFEKARLFRDKMENEEKHKFTRWVAIWGVAIAFFSLIVSVLSIILK